MDIPFFSMNQSGRVSVVEFEREGDWACYFQTVRRVRSYHHRRSGPDQATV